MISQITRDKLYLDPKSLFNDTLFLVIDDKVRGEFNKRTLEFSVNENIKNRFPVEQLGRAFRDLYKRYHDKEDNASPEIERFYPNSCLEPNCTQALDLAVYRVLSSGEFYRKLKYYGINDLSLSPHQIAVLSEDFNLPKDFIKAKIEVLKSGKSKAIIR